MKNKEMTHVAYILLLIVILPQLSNCAAAAKCKSTDELRFPLYDGRSLDGLQLKPVRFGTPSHRDNVSTVWFKQQLDHFNQSDTRTWRQVVRRYMVNSRWYRKDGPIFLLLGGEGPISTGMIETDEGVVKMDWMKNAIAQGALAFQLEHRYYGNSIPVDQLANAFTAANLQYLSSRQAIRDAANFIRTTKKHLALKESQKWIVFGGSYSGNLAAWFREKHPDLVAGAIASSAPLKAELDYKQYMRVVGEDLKKVSQQCYDTTELVFNELHTLLSSGFGRAHVQRVMNICDHIDASSPDSLGLLYDTLISPFMTVAQYGGDNVPYILLLISYVHEPLDRLVRVHNLVNPSAFCSCNNVDYHDYLLMLRANTGYKPWFYQKCTEFGYFKTTDGVWPQPFGQGAITTQFRIDPCQTLFGLNRADIEQRIADTNGYYGGRRAFNTTNVVLINGSQDPWHALGITYALQNRQNYDVLYVNGTGHCADMYPAAATDPPSMTNARQFVADKISSWLL